ncbi:MAG: DUF2283 domain-containing protein [Chloroflexi bacterium]|nr:DUF2283 domain-containing protein [Chloroflexota bacterium]
MGERLSFYYDREADILYFSQGQPYPEQESQEMGDDMVVRLNPKTRNVEGITILNFSRRFTGTDILSIPITAQMQLART